MFTAHERGDYIGTRLRARPREDGESFKLLRKAKLINIQVRRNSLGRPGFGEPRRSRRKGQIQAAPEFEKQRIDTMKTMA